MNRCLVFGESIKTTIRKPVALNWCYYLFFLPFVLESSIGNCPKMYKYSFLLSEEISAFELV